MRDLAKILGDYVADKLDPETEIEMDGLILQYVDGELDPEKATEVKAAMEADPAVAAHIEQSMRAAKTVQDQLVPAFEAFELPLDPELEKSLADLIADPNAWGKEPDEDDQAHVVVPLLAPQVDDEAPARRPARLQPTWGAMAASIAALLAVGAGTYLYDLQGDSRREQQMAALEAEVRQITEERVAERNGLTRQVTALGIQLDEVTTARNDAAKQLAETTVAMEGLNADQARLSAELAAANDEAVAVQAERNSLEEQIAALDADMRQAVEARVIERDQLTREVANLENRLADATTTRDDVAKQLADAETAIEGLNADRASLSAELAAATDDVKSAQVARDTLEQQLAALDADMRQANEAFATERNALTDQAATLQARLDAAVKARDQLDTQLTDARTAIETLDAEKDAATSQLAALGSKITGLEGELAETAVAQETLQSRLDATIEESRERVAALESDLDQAQGQVAGLRQAGVLLLAETERLRKEATWINQVVGYHRGYAGTPREVEGSEEGPLSARALVNWFKMKLGHPFPVPDLDGLKFVGGRVFFVNGVPIGQIAYHDSEGRLTGLCFTPGLEGPTSDLVKGQDEDLNLVYWQKKGFQYLLVGWAGFGQLEPLAKQLRETYGDDV